MSLSLFIYLQPRSLPRPTSGIASLSVILRSSHPAPQLATARKFQPRCSHFTTSPSKHSAQNRIHNSVTIPPTFHDYLRSASASNTLLLCLFTSSACTPCRTISPLLQSLILSRAPAPHDKFASLAYAEVELDSPDTSNGAMSELGVEWGIRSMPTLVGFGGRRAERVTERLVDTKMMGDRVRMRDWVDDQMAKGDPNATGGGGGGILARIFG